MWAFKWQVNQKECFDNQAVSLVSDFQFVYLCTLYISEDAVLPCNLFEPLIFTTWDLTLEMKWTEVNHLEQQARKKLTSEGVRVQFSWWFVISWPLSKGNLSSIIWKNNSVEKTIILQVVRTSNSDFKTNVDLKRDTDFLQPVSVQFQGDGIKSDLKLYLQST